MGKKGQSAIEFMIIIGAVLFFFLAFFYALQVQKADQIKENFNLQVKDTASIVKSEINLAVESSDGYYRNFKLPGKIGGVLDYDIRIDGTLLYISADNDKYSMALSVVNVTGQPIKGDNLIRKSGGQIFLN